MRAFGRLKAPGVLAALAVMLGLLAAPALRLAVAQDDSHAATTEHAGSGGGHGDGSGGGHGDGSGGGHGGGHGNPTPMAMDVDLAIFTFVVFAILFVILAKFAWKPMAEALDRRETSIANQIAAAERTYAEAKGLLAQYESKLAASQDEVRAILDKARHDATHASQEIVAKATSEAAGVVERGKREIETATTQALNELAEKSAKLAVDLAGRIIRAEVNTTGHQHLIQEALSKFPVSN